MVTAAARAIRRNSSGTAPAFVPTQISGCALWLDANQITGVADGGAVAAWNDTSGNARNVTQVTAAKQPLYRNSNTVVTLPNGKPVLQFDGVNSVMTGSSVGTLGDFSAFVVASIATLPINNGTAVHTWQNGSNTNVGLENFTNSGNFYSVLYGGVAHNSSGTQDVANTYFQQEAVRSSGTLTQYANGVTLPSTYVNTPSAATGSTWIGANNGAEFFVGQIAELVVYSRGLTATERQQVEGYLRLKYGTP